MSKEVTSKRLAHLTEPSLAEAASILAVNGFHVFRIRPGEKVPMDRWVNGDETQVATSDPAEVERRWGQTPNANIGIATGNGIAVLDIDPENGGKVPSWAPETRCVTTPSGGVHLYYKVSGFVKTSAGTIAPGVDVRGDGGMVVAPPSWIKGLVGGDGVPRKHTTYKWANSLPLARCDVALLSAPRPDGQYSGRRVKLAATQFNEGQRHQAMLTLAGKIRSVGGERPEIAAALHALNKSRFNPVLDDEWVEKLCDSIMQYDPDHDLIR